MAYAAMRVLRGVRYRSSVGCLSGTERAYAATRPSMPPPSAASGSAPSEYGEIKCIRPSFWYRLHEDCDLKRLIWPRPRYLYCAAGVPSLWLCSYGKDARVVLTHCY
eukprot:2133939-Rhodomonas_salina.1